MATTAATTTTLNPITTTTAGSTATSRRGRRLVLRRIGAVFAGLAAITVLSSAIDLVLHAAGVFPPWGQPMNDVLFVLAFGYRAALGVLSGWLTARLAPDRARAHAVALGIVGVVFSLAGAAATWNRGPEFGPRWYPLLLAAVSVPAAWAGGWLRTRRLAVSATER